ncbi:MAG: hypothetical protein JSR33_09175 [Proteobacteria bacterium]|nr:hypothetical protein [Pseudomonadota bacterium]
MKNKKEHCCQKLTKEINRSKIFLLYIKNLREYGIRILDGGTSFQSVYYCPWCGAKLPHSLRNEWFDTLDSMGFDDPREQDIPLDYKSDAWWRKKY